MIKILNNTKDLPTLVADTTNGLGKIDPISCLVTEELNGIYECEFTFLATDKHFNDLSVGGIVKMSVNEAGNEQLFRIYYISKPMNQVVTVRGQHITYDLNKVPVSPFSATGAAAAKNGMLSHIMGTYPFTMTTNIANTTSKFTLDIPRSFRECLGGYEGSLLDVFRGEYEYDNLTVKMLTSRGSDNNVRISYGKNLTDFTQEENIENLYTSVLGYAVVDGRTYTGNVYNKVTATYPKVKIVDFSEDYVNDSGEATSIPTTEQLTLKAQQYANRNNIEIPRVSISIAFVPLYQTEEYKNIAPLERVSLGDTVHVYFEKLGVEASSRVIKTVWNVNLNRYDSVELGEAKANMNTVLDSVTEEVATQTSQGQSFIESQLNQMASLIINGLGLHQTLVETEGGGYRIYLHNKETLEESDTQYIFTAEGFLVSTDYGQTWNAGFDADGNAVVNSLSTIVLKALEVYGSYIEGATLLFGDPDDQNVRVYTYQNGVRFLGTGPIDMRTTHRINLYALNNDGDIGANLQVSTNPNYNTSNLAMVSYDLDNNYSACGMSVTKTTNQRSVDMHTYRVGTQDYGNQIYMWTNSSTNSLEISNYTSSGVISSRIIMNTALQSLLLECYNTSGNVVCSLELSRNGNVNIKGTHVYFNGTQKW